MKKSGNACRIVFGLLAAAGLFLLAPRLMAQVDQAELGTPPDLEFINYVGPQARIDTLAEIRAIGYGLGQIMRGGAAQAGAAGRYFVIHSVTDQDGNRLNADIFGLGPDVGVDHIRNLRLIIQGYLEAAYSYSERDAALLSRYITIYNAVYRGDTGYYGSRYSGPVMANIVPEKAGLSIRYDEWPGQTLMLIPLGSGLGGPLSIIDTPTLTDDRVLEQLRQEPDLAIADRQEMVDLMERQADEAEQVAQAIRETVRQEEEAIPAERQAAQQEVQAAQQEQRQIEAERQQPAAQQPEAQQALDQRQAEAQQREEAAQETLQELDRREEAVEEMRQEASQQETYAEEIREAAQEQRQEIAEDQQSIIERPPATVAQGESVLGVAILNPASSLGRLVLLDNANVEIRQSQLNTVNTRTITVTGNRIFAIAGMSQGSGAIRLVEIDPSTLEMSRQGNDDLAQGSLLWSRGQDYYAIASTGGVLNMARFNSDFVLQARSAIEVHPYATVIFNAGYLLTQRSDGSAVLLDPADLTERITTGR